METFFVAGILHGKRVIFVGRNKAMRSVERGGAQKAGGGWVEKQVW